MLRAMPQGAVMEQADVGFEVVAPVEIVEQFPLAPHRGEPVPATSRLDLREITPQIDAEMSFGLAWSVPLAVGGATLLAQGAMLSSETCTGLGLLCIISIAVIQRRVRRRVRNKIADATLQQGLPQAAGQTRADEYLNSWMG